MHSFEFINEVGDWEDEDADLSDMFWPYADTKTEMQDKLTKDYNKLIRIIKDERRDNDEKVFCSNIFVAAAGADPQNR